MTDSRNYIYEKADREFGSLSEPELAYFTVQGLVASIQNGGLISYYYNSYADHLQPCMRALERIGARDMLDLVQEMNRLFGERVPSDQEARNAIIDLWGDDPRIDAKLDAMSENEQELAEATDVLLEDYLRQNGLVA
jgi:hypothetical protein